MLTRLLPLLLLAPSFGSSVALATDAPAAAASDLVTIGTIDGESDARMSIINIRLDRNPGWSRVSELQDHGSFLQLVIPNALVPEPGKFFDGNNPYLPKVAVFQLTPSDAAVRLFANRDAARIKQASQAEILGNRIVLTVDHARLASGTAAAEAPVGPFVGPPVPEELRPTPSISAEDVIAKTEVRHDIPAPSDALKGTNGAEVATSPLATGGIDLREKLTSVTIFSGVMLVGLLIFWMARPYMKRRAAAARGETEPQISMRTIASLPLAARQKVSLIQVGDEKILIGVTPEAVTFLTAIGKSAPQAAPAPAPFANMTRSLPFARALEDNSPAVDLKPAPVLKNIEGNDEESLRAAYSRPATPSPEGRPVAKPAKARPAPSGRINLSVGEDGVKSLVSRTATRTKSNDGEGEDSQKAIDDVTRLIREKLKTLRTI